mgnify:CR=1 FL=1
MYLDHPLEYFVLIIVGFISGGVNTLAGGGSLLTLPILIFLGLPPTIANATNRIGILFQATSASAGYASKGVWNYPFNIYLGISALLGSLIGAKIAIDIDDGLFNKVLSIIMIIVLLIIVLKPKHLKNNYSEITKGKHLWISIFFFFFIGIYGGFINAGIGIVILLFLNKFNRFSLVKSNATKVSIVSIYTFAAVIYFWLNNKIDWQSGFVLAIGMSIGGWFSSRISVNKGDGFIKIVLVIVVSLMSIRLWFY